MCSIHSSLLMKGGDFRFVYWGCTGSTVVRGFIRMCSILSIRGVIMLLVRNNGLFIIRVIWMGAGMGLWLWFRIRGGWCMTGGETGISETSELSRVREDMLRVYVGMEDISYLCVLVMGSPQGATIAHKLAMVLTVMKHGSSGLISLVL